MREYSFVNIKDNLTPFVFYNSFIPQLHNILQSNLPNGIIIDLSAISRISPLVIPNLLIVGRKLNEYLKEPARLQLPWNIRLLSYLDAIKFFQFVRKDNIYKLNEESIGGYSTDDKVLSNICLTFSPDINTSKETLLINFKNTYSPILEKVYPKETVDRLLNVMAETCHNGSHHSGDKCFATFQINKSKSFLFAVADGGLGFHKSFTNGIEEGSRELKIFSKEEFFNSTEKNMMAVLEALFYRCNENVYGLYSVMKDTLHSKTIIRYHTDNTQIVFTKSNFRSYIDKEPTKDVMKSIKDNFLHIRAERKDDYYSPLRIRESRIAGVHIEFEIHFTEE